LTTAEMQGASAQNTMTGLDFETVWQAQTDPADYPILMPLESNDSSIDQQDPVQRFDTNGEPGIQGDEVLDAISEFNEGGDVEATDVLDVISAFNENSG